MSNAENQWFVRHVLEAYRERIIIKRDNVAHESTVLTRPEDRREASAHVDALTVVISDLDRLTQYPDGLWVVDVVEKWKKRPKGGLIGAGT